MITRIKGQVVQGSVRNKVVSFFVVNEADVIQRRHNEGAFYEAEELALIEKHFEAGTVFVDIGANVGNHSIYTALFLKPGRLIAFEPNPDATALFQINSSLNNLTVKDIRIQSALNSSSPQGNAKTIELVKAGLSKSTALAVAETPENNLGGTHLTETTDGTLQLIQGDSILEEIPVSFLKIDVEGMELDVLTGLNKTISKYSPKIFIEVDNANIAAFEQWTTQHSYRIADRYKRYKANENFMLVFDAGVKALADQAQSSTTAKTSVSSGTILDKAVPWSDAYGNSISGNADGNLKIHFKGKNCRLILAPGVTLHGQIWFDSDAGEVHIGERCAFKGGIRVGKNAKITLGKFVTVADSCFISAVEGTSVTIGDDCMFATRNQIRSDDAHAIYDNESGQRLNHSKNVHIGSHVWLAYEALVFGGAKIGDGSAVGVRALVTQVIPPNSLVEGVPAKIVRMGIRWDRGQLSSE